MHHECTAEADWENTDGTNHRINMNVDLLLQDFLRGQDIRAELLRDENFVRQQIAQIVVHELIPDLIHNSGESGDFPNGTLKSKARHSIHSDWKTIDKDGRTRTPSVRSRLQILFEINTDRSVGTMQALNANSGALASAITDNIVHSLKSKYLGIKEEKTSTETNVRNGRLTRYDTEPSRN